MSLPEVRASRAVLLSLASNGLVSGRDGGTYTPAGPGTAAAAAAAGAGAGAGTETAGTPGSVPGSEGVEQPAGRSGVRWRNLCKAR